MYHASFLSERVLYPHYMILVPVSFRVFVGFLNLKTALDCAVKSPPVSIEAAREEH